MWIGLEPVGIGEGVAFLPGSHRWGRKFMPEAFDGSGAKAAMAPGFEPTPDFSEVVADGDLLEFELEPGDCLIFDSKTVHGAPNPVPPNSTVHRMTMRFAPGGARFTRQGPWTDDQVNFLVSAEHTVDGPLEGPLLPLLWSREQGRMPAPRQEDP